MLSSLIRALSSPFMCTWTSPILPLQWLLPNLHSILKSLPHSIQERSVNYLIPNLRQKVQARISSTLLPQPQITDVYCIRITISLVSDTIKIFCPKSVSPPVLRILFPSVLMGPRSTFLCIFKLLFSHFSSGL